MCQHLFVKTAKKRKIWFIIEYNKKYNSDEKADAQKTAGQ